jgi:hypothetical protein
VNEKEAEEVLQEILNIAYSDPMGDFIIKEDKKVPDWSKYDAYEEYLK